ncbi:MAG: gliding motility-associated ABC transporter substrate-binding protein GldG [Paludibacter sp.]|nr:gliding motility-associated ABC transporter substrate-binding protein GldG [Paludibacter sp.]MDD4198055.1 gliding motility-associated ABC transporter substrate-binding protein GldG [Paludibacter sp.]MDD4427030.1 gliding motility-associated ABC transporter substrate-binding protein GldG [Paludibacter sp.]
MKNKIKLTSILSGLLTLAFLVFFTIWTCRIDLTEDSRYSISDCTKELIKGFDTPLQITLYLNGDLNPAFLRLRKTTIDMIDDLSNDAKYTISINNINPSDADSEEQRLSNYALLAERGLKPSEVYMRDKDGKSIRKIIFPWIEIMTKEQTIAVPLLKNIRNKSGEENINISIENLEFEISDALSRLKNKEIRKIAFLEGHGELTEAETYQISKSLSKYFQIDRGELQNDASVLNDYQAIIIANPVNAFNEREKYILDQYIMYGGSVLWLVNGVRFDKQQLSQQGFSPVIEADLNLNDLFFRYGIRINPVLVQDMQCVYMPINIAPAGEQAQFDLVPWHFSPLLLSSDAHPITKNTGEIMAEFISTISTTEQHQELQTDVLLATSNRSKILPVPASITLNESGDSDESSFNTGYLPVAILISGIFQSNFTNRIPPKDIKNNRPFRTQSIETKQLFIAGGSIIRNETNGIASDSTTLPLGYDRIMNATFGNETFLINAINYLTNQDERIQLRAKTFKTRLLNQHISKQKRTTLQIVNVVLPLVILIFFAFIFNGYRKKTYAAKKQ